MIKYFPYLSINLLEGIWGNGVRPEFGCQAKWCKNGVRQKMENGNGMERNEKVSGKIEKIEKIFLT